MLRRFEIYSLDPAAPAAQVELLRTSLRDCPRHIPEVLYSAVGDNLSSAPLQLAWEHAYASPEAYRRYMVHPFHATVLDRFLLADSPERVTTDNRLGLGLAGYACEGPSFALDAGVRRLVFLDLSGATDGEIGSLAEQMQAAAAGPAPLLAVSVFAENSMASRWFDGETETAPAPRWTHLWEQGFADEASWHSYLEGDALLADAEGPDRRPVPVVTKVSVVRYVIEAGPA